MSGAAVGWTILTLIIAVAVIAVIVYLMKWLYRRSSSETAFVRTGLGGEKVVLNGGAFVLPIIHDVIPVNMNTLRLEVRRARESALITKNRMRVDVVAEFYVRVQAEQQAISHAAQTLGRRTMQPDSLKELLEGKFIDALRSVAAEMTMEELHEQRGRYVNLVGDAVGAYLGKNGLELEAVSLTGMDQADMQYFNPSNAFDAEGLTRLTEEIERRKKLRNDIEQDTLIEIRRKNLESEKLALDIDRDSEYARLEQERDLQSRRASQRATVAQEQAEREREAEQARIAAQQEIERARINSQRSLDEERIRGELETQRAEVERRKALEIAEQERAIELAEKSKQQSLAQAAAELERAKVVEAEEMVFTARERQIAERRKQVRLMEAAEEAEAQGLRVRLSAEAEKSAAADRAEAARRAAEGEADAAKVRALAEKLKHEVDAEGRKLMNQALNTLTNESRASEMRLRLIDKMDSIIRESAKPMERIEGIKILHVDGLGGVQGRNGYEGNGAGPEGGGSGNVANDMVNAALRYRAQGPLVDGLLGELGIAGGGDFGKLAQSLALGGKLPEAEPQPSKPKARKPAQKSGS